MKVEPNYYIMMDNMEIHFHFIFVPCVEKVCTLTLFELSNFVPSHSFTIIEEEVCCLKNGQMQIPNTPLPKKK